MLIGDIETDGFLDTLTKIHCAVFYNTITNIYTEFTPETVQDIPKFLDTEPELCMHNGIGFDLQVLKKIFNYTYKGLYRDSLLMSRIFWPDKNKNFFINTKGKRIFCKKGPHSVENWGIEFKNHKPEYEEWDIYTPAMLHRCKEDVKIQTMLYFYIQRWSIILQKKDKRISHLDNVWNMEQRIWEIMEQQAINGWAFDVNKAYQCIGELETMLTQIDKKLTASLPTKYVPFSKDKKAVTKAFTQEGDVTSVAGKWLGDKNLHNLAGDFCKVIHKEINLNSYTQVKDFLFSIGWRPVKFNVKKDKFNKPIRDEKGQLIKTTAKIPDTLEEWESLAKKLKHPSVIFMANRGKIKHRLSSIKGYIESLRSDGRIEAQVISCSTNTARMTHKIVVNVPKVSEKKFYGKEMRSLFITERGKILVGCDANALEGRCEAHYTHPYDPAYALELVNGDIHTKNMEVFKRSREECKSLKYALLYGCSVNKLMGMLDSSKSEAQLIYDNFWQSSNALLRLKEDLIKEWKTFGYILGIDGRPITIRYEHALINSLFQSAGAIAMKIANCWLDRNLRNRGYEFWQVGNFHDEIQIECWPKDADVIGKLMEKSIEMAGKILKFNVPLLGESKKGINWALTH